MRPEAVLFLLSLMLGPPGPAPRLLGAAPVAPAAAARSAVLTGAWSGEWSGPTASARGPMELVLAGAPGGDGMIGQFTFVTGGVSRTLRYEGHFENGVLRFPLVGEGHLVLRPQAVAVRLGEARALQGEWMDARGALPAPRGSLRLSRSPVR